MGPARDPEVETPSAPMASATNLSKITHRPVPRTVIDVALIVPAVPSRKVSTQTMKKRLGSAELNVKFKLHTSNDQGLTLTRLLLKTRGKPQR